MHKIFHHATIEQAWNKYQARHCAKQAIDTIMNFDDETVDFWFHVDWLHWLHVDIGLKEKER